MNKVPGRGRRQDSQPCPGHGVEAGDLPRSAGMKWTIRFRARVKSPQNPSPGSQ